MICAYCGDTTEYNRQIRIEGKEVPIGGLCLSCENTQFGDLHTDPVTSRECYLCGEQAEYVLPEHQLEYDDSNVSECCIEGFFVTETTPRLCGKHLPNAFVTADNPTEAPPERVIM